MKIQDLLVSIKKQQLKPVYLILGREGYLNRLLKKIFTELIPSSQRTMNLAQYDLDTVPMSSVINDIMSAPFMGKYRLVFVQDPIFLTGHRSKLFNRSDVNHLIKYLKRPLSSTILVIFAPYQKLDGRKTVTKVLKAHSDLINLNQISERDVRNFVATRITQSGYQISSLGLDLLIQKTGGQLSAIMTEIPKLFLYCHQKKSISSKAVDALVTQSLNQNIFNLVKFVLNHQVTQAISFYHDLLTRGEQPLKINAILVSQFRLLLQVMILHQHGNSELDISRLLRVHPYRVKLALITITNCSINRLRSAYLELVNMERQLKSANQSPQLLFEMFLIRFIQVKQKRNQV